MPRESPSVLVIGAQGVFGRMCTEALRGAGLDVIRAGRRAEDAADFRLIDLDERIIQTLLQFNVALFSAVSEDAVTA